MEKKPEYNPHFEGKSPFEHVVQKQATGIITTSEGHGEEMPGHLFAFADSARETAFLLLLIGILFYPSLPPPQIIVLFGLGWTIWKAGRTARLGWSRLERLNRLVAEEKWEIDHHRDDEREELRALYEAKGFKGKLLDDVIEVLMADGDRLLRVMLEEELGLTLEKMEHPLKEALGSAIGAVIAFVLSLAGYLLWPPIGLIIVTLFIIGAGGGISAYYNKNKKISAIIWNIAIATFSAGITFFLFEYLNLSAS